MISWSSLDALARHQWGLLTKGQVLEAMGKTNVDRYRARGLLVPIYPGVFRLAGAPASWRQRMMAACLAYGQPVAASHRAAALLWEIDGIVAKDCEVTVPVARAGVTRES